jgi:hypothetical protein
MKKLVIISIATIMAGCSGTPTVDMSTPVSVVLGNVNANDTVKNLTLAEQECLKYSKHAVAKGTNRNNKTASFECKDG